MKFRLRENYFYKMIVLFSLPQKKLFHQTEPLNCFKTKMSRRPSIIFHETSVEKRAKHMTVVLT